MKAFILLLLFAGTCFASDWKASKIIDLTYAFNDQTIYWPTAKPFAHEKVSWGNTEAGFWYSSANYSASEHGGTHLDAPIHFAENAWTSDQIPADRFIGNLLVVDVTAAAQKDPDYQASAEDFQNWEKKNGKISEGSIVLLRTGWGKHWPDKKKYLGDDTPGKTDALHFPAFSKAAAEFLASRKVKGVAIDTASIDPGNSKLFEAHRTFAKNNIYGIENIANAEQLPVKGATLIALPMKIENGTGGPARVIALLR